MGCARLHVVFLELALVHVAVHEGIAAVAALLAARVPALVDVAIAQTPELERPNFACVAGGGAEELRRAACQLSLHAPAPP
jgi:hypothetical protein